MKASSSLKSQSSPDRWIFGSVLLMLIWLPLPWGSNSEAAASFATTAFSLLCCAWLVLYALGRIKLKSQWSGAVWASLVIWILWLLWITVQILPLPVSLLELYAPTSVALQESVPDLRLYESPAYGHISIAPSLTVAQLLNSGGYFVLYLLVLLTVNSKKRVTIFLWTLTLSGLFQALYGMHMTLTGMEYGFLEKKTYGLGISTGTFVNRNHYAAYLELTLAAGIGIVLSELGQWRMDSMRGLLRDLISLLLSKKFRARVALVAMVAALVLTRSRMGNVAFFISLCSCGMLFTFLRYRKWFIPSLFLFGSLLIVDLFVVSRWFGLDAVVERLEETNLDTEKRTLVLEDLQPVIRDYATTGAGLGTFALAHSPYRNEFIRGYFNHAHNEYAEFMVEVGIVGCTLLGLILLTHILHCVRILVRRKTIIYAAAAFSSLMAIVAMSVHATTEFMLRIPAVAATFVALMALGMSMSSQSRTSRSEKTAVDPLEPHADST